MVVEIADDADQAIWTKLDTTFAATKVLVLHLGHRGDIPCDVNPLGKRCQQKDQIGAACQPGAAPVDCEALKPK